MSLVLLKGVCWPTGRAYEYKKYRTLQANFYSVKVVVGNMASADEMSILRRRPYNLSGRLGLPFGAHLHCSTLLHECDITILVLLFFG